jgi:hypothetical protein
LGGSPRIYAGELRLSSESKLCILKLGFSHGRPPALKRNSPRERPPAGLESSFTRINAGAHQDFGGKGILPLAASCSGVTWQPTRKIGAPIKSNCAAAQYVYCSSTTSLRDEPAYRYLDSILDRPGLAIAF